MSHLKKSDTNTTFPEDESIEISQTEVLNSIQARQAAPQKLTFASFCWNRLCKFLLPLLVIGGIIYGVLYALGIQMPTKEQIPFSDFLFSRDGWAGLTAEDLPKWNTRGSGVLKLEMLNGLEDHWQPYFEQSILEWNMGEPDVVELTVTKVAADSGCDFVKGKFSVCAGDYGDTSFHGVNEILVYEGAITASVAKLNEYYLATASEARKQYTMCHELGHGFGLPHSDENFFNLNLGNCMDYTDRPWTNTAPDTQTFELLNQIYGIPTANPDGTEGSNVVSAATSTSNNLRGSDEEDEPTSIPDTIFQRAKEATSNLESKFASGDSDEEWVQTHRDNATAAFEIELGDGYFLQAHFLLAR